ncbi:MAG: hypothetical protein ACRD4P_15320 [Bryobacteraceae bacterium]
MEPFVPFQKHVDSGTEGVEEGRSGFVREPPQGFGEGGGKLGIERYSIRGRARGAIAYPGDRVHGEPAKGFTGFNDHG